MSRSRRRQKKDVFSVVAAVKSNARDRIGTPKASFVITPKNQRSPRYKEKFTEIDDEINTEKE